MSDSEKAKLRAENARLTDELRKCRLRELKLTLPKAPKLDELGIKVEPSITDTHTAPAVHEINLPEKPNSTTVQPLKAEPTAKTAEQTEQPNQPAEKAS
jgi:hypothetical protein